MTSDLLLCKSSGQFFCKKNTKEIYKWRAWPAVFFVYINSEDGRQQLDPIRTREQLIHFYEKRNPGFNYYYSSYLGDDANEYVFPKMEYMLAQECFRDDCSSKTRKALLQMVIDKQKKKYVEYQNSYPSRLTGLFLMAVILVKEGDPAFITALKENENIQNTLCITHNIQDDKEFCDVMIQFAEKFLNKK